MLFSSLLWNLQGFLDTATEINILTDVRFETTMRDWSTLLHVHKFGHLRKLGAPRLAFSTTFDGDYIAPDQKFSSSIERINVYYPFEHTAEWLNKVASSELCLPYLTRKGLYCNTGDGTGSNSCFTNDMKAAILGEVDRLGLIDVVLDLYEYSGGQEMWKQL